MKIHQSTVDEALTSLQSRPDGLTDAEAVQRLAEYGPNIVAKVKRRPIFVKFLSGFTHFFAIILWLAALLAWVADVYEPGQGMRTLAAAIIGVILINGIFSFWQEFRAEQAFQALQNLLPQITSVIRNGVMVRIGADQLVPGDILVLESGANVPADARIIEAHSLRVNNATVTGESLPHSRNSERSNEPDFVQSQNVLLAGTSIVSGTTKAVVFATGAHSAFGQIAHLTQTTNQNPSPLQLEIARLSRLVALFSVSLGIIFFFVGRAIGLPFWGNFIFAIGIIVANVPEGLLPTVTLALAMGSQRMAGRNALIRHLPAVETLGATTVICTDKTGTLTQNQMAVKLLHADGRTFRPSDVGPDRSLGALPLFEVARHCHGLKPAVDKAFDGDPLEVAIVTFVTEVTSSSTTYPRINEFPFDSQRRRYGAIHQSTDGPVFYLKGAPEVVLPFCTRKNSAASEMTLEDRKEILRAQDEMARKGLRVLAFAHRQIPETYDENSLEQEMVFDGLMGLEDPPRAEVPGAIQKCHEAGIRVIMVTGDNPRTAEAIAREIGLVKSIEPVVITGDRLKSLSDTQLQLALDASEILFARVTADQKMRIVAALKRKQQIVAVTGDGVNDAPALKKADIGISMGRCGTDVARESADIILLDDNFATIVSAIEEGRTVYANIRKFLTYILTSNVPELVPYLAFVLFKIPLPLTIIQILAVDLGTDMLPALALGAEPPNPRAMQEPPRPRTERLMDAALLLRSYCFLGLIEAMAAMAAFFFVLSRGGWHYGDILEPRNPLYLQATSACLSAIIVTQMANVLVCRSRRDSVFQSSLGSNPLILWGIVTEATLILVIDYTPWGQTIFGTAGIDPVVWLAIVPFALLLLFLEEARKWVIRRCGRGQNLAHAEQIKESAI